MKDPKAVAAEHWGYIRTLLEIHNTNTYTIEKVGFHYRTAFIHGWKHGKEEAESDKENMEDGVMKK